MTYDQTILKQNQFDSNKFTSSLNKVNFIQMNSLLFKTLPMRSRKVQPQKNLANSFEDQSQHSQLQLILKEGRATENALD